MIATTSHLQLATSIAAPAPNMLSHNGNLVVSPVTGHAVVPYATIGIGGLTMFERPPLGIPDETFLTGNVGGGVGCTHQTIAGDCVATIASATVPRMMRRNSWPRQPACTASTAPSS